MSVFERWSLRVVGALCCALVGAAWVPGVAGATASAQKWAVVSSDGTLVRGNGATSATRLATGTYDVHFSSSMSRCAFEVTAGDTADAGATDPVEAAVGTQPDVPRGVELQTFDQSTGMLADESFHLMTYCGVARDFAVVDTDGSLARSSHAVSSTRTATGQYDVVFDRDVHACTFTATIGAAGDGGGFIFVGEISVAGLFHNRNGVLVSTRARTGAAADFQFHLAVSCGTAPLTGVINVDGSKARGKHVVASQLLFENGSTPAGYRVVFDRDMTACSFTASVGLPRSSGSVSDPVTISAASRTGFASAVFVFVQNVNGTVQSEPFHLVVTC